MRANHTWNAPDVLKRFEYLIDPFPPDDADAPPQRLGAFLIHYSRAALPWLLAMAVLTAALSVV
jgi:ATP-binding cassette subfamily B multidrug efflux pump